MKLRLQSSLKSYDKAPAPCEDSHSDASECAVFAKQGECEKNEAWMKRNCAKTCQFCFDDVTFLRSEFITHLQGKKAFKQFRKKDVHSVTMFWEPGCKYCAMAKPIFAKDAERASQELPEVEFQQSIAHETSEFT